MQRRQQGDRRLPLQQPGDQALPLQQQQLVALALGGALQLQFLHPLRLLQRTAALALALVLALAVTAPGS